MSPCSDSVSLRLPYSVKLATQRKSLTHYTKGTPSPSINGSIDPPALACPGFRKLTERIFCRAAHGERPSLFVTTAINAGLRLFVCIRFQDLLHSPSGVLFAFPSRYWFAIGRSRVFSLGGWSPHVQTGFHVSRPTCRTPSSTSILSSTGLSPTMAVLSRTLD